MRISPSSVLRHLLPVALCGALLAQACALPQAPASSNKSTADQVEVVIMALTPDELAALDGSYSEVSSLSELADYRPMHLSSYDQGGGPVGSNSSAFAVTVPMLAIAFFAASGITIAVFNTKAPVPHIGLDSLSDWLFSADVDGYEVQGRVSEGAARELANAEASSLEGGALIAASRRAQALQIAQMAVTPEGEMSGSHVIVGQGDDAIALVPSEVPTCEALIAAGMTPNMMEASDRAFDAVATGVAQGVLRANVGYCFDEAGKLYMSALTVEAPKGLSALEVRLFHLPGSHASATIDALDIFSYGPPPIVHALPPSPVIPPGGNSLLSFLHDTGVVTIGKSPRPTRAHQLGFGATLTVIRL